jgi:chromosome segregation ATPase
MSDLGDTSLEDVPQHFLDQLDEAYRQLEEKDRDLMMAAQFGRQLLDAKEELEEQLAALQHELAAVTTRLKQETAKHQALVASFQEKETSNQSTIAVLQQQVEDWKQKTLAAALDRSGLTDSNANRLSEAATRVPRLEKDLEQSRDENETLRGRMSAASRQAQQLQKELAAARADRDALSASGRELEEQLASARKEAKARLREEARSKELVGAEVRAWVDGRVSARGGHCSRAAVVGLRACLAGSPRCRRLRELVWWHSELLHPAPALACMRAR